MYKKYTPKYECGELEKEYKSLFYKIDDVKCDMVEKLFKCVYVQKNVPKRTQKEYDGHISDIYIEINSDLVECIKPNKIFFEYIRLKDHLYKFLLFESPFSLYRMYRDIAISSKKLVFAEFCYNNRIRPIWRQSDKQYRINMYMDYIIYDMVRQGHTYKKDCKYILIKENLFKVGLCDDVINIVFDYIDL